MLNVSFPKLRSRIQCSYDSAQQWIIANTVVYLLAIMFAKLSILIFYYRLMGINKHFRWALYCVATLVIGYCLSLTLALIFQCTPPAAVWSLAMRPQAQCLNMVEIDVAIGAFNIPTGKLPCTSSTTLSEVYAGAARRVLQSDAYLSLTTLTPESSIDVIILVLPIPLLWSLQMPLPKKLGLMGILATGIL